MLKLLIENIVKGVATLARLPLLDSEIDLLIHYANFRQLQADPFVQACDVFRYPRILTVAIG